MRAEAIWEDHELSAQLRLLKSQVVARKAALTGGLPIKWFALDNRQANNKANSPDFSTVSAWLTSEGRFAP
jgi:hypothetical protein